MCISPPPTHSTNKLVAGVEREASAKYRFGLLELGHSRFRRFFGEREAELEERERERSHTHRPRAMDGKKEDGYLLGVYPRTSTPPRATLAQLAEERLGSLQYLLQSKNGVTSSPPSRNRPRASTATSTSTTGGTSRSAGRVRRSTSGNVEEAATDASVARNRGLFSSASNVASRERWGRGVSQSARGSC